MNRKPHIKGNDIFIYEDWQVILFNGVGLEWKRDFKNLIARLNQPDSVLKHDHRSQVGLIEIDGIKYIIKKFILQESWWWFQLTSLWFPTLGELACRNAFRLLKNGLLTPKPTLLLQKVKNGFVIDCWLVYGYLDGKPASVSDAKLIVNFIQRMHKVNLIHRDPHPGNFIKTDSGLATLDPLRICSTTSKYMKAYDIVLLENDIPEAPDIYGLNELGLYFRLAKFGHNLVRLYRKLKYLFRQILGIKNHY